MNESQPYRIHEASAQATSPERTSDAFTAPLVHLVEAIREVGTPSAFDLTELAELLNIQGPEWTASWKAAVQLSHLNEEIAASAFITPELQQQGAAYAAAVELLAREEITSNAAEVTRLLQKYPELIQRSREDELALCAVTSEWQDTPAQSGSTLPAEPPVHIGAVWADGTTTSLKYGQLWVNHWALPPSLVEPYQQHIDKVYASTDTDT